MKTNLLCFLTSVLISILINGCSSNVSDLSLLKNNRYSSVQEFQNKTISVVPHKKDTNSAAFGYQVSGLLIEAGFTVFDNLGLKTNITTVSKESDNSVITIREKSDDNFAQTDLIIESFISRNTCSLRLFDQNTGRIVASSSMRCVLFPTREQSIKAIHDLKLIELSETGSLLKDEQRISNAQKANIEHPLELTNKTFTVIPHNFSDIQMEEVLIVESDLSSMGFLVDRLPSGTKEVEIESKTENEVIMERYLAFPPIKSDFQILSSPVLNYQRGRFYVQNVTLTLVESVSGKIVAVYSGFPSTSYALTALLNKSGSYLKNRP